MYSDNFKPPTGKRSWKYELDEDDPHIPNKQEAKLLRRLMAETGNTEEEIRSISKYKRMLAEAQRSPQKGNRGNRRTRYIEREWKNARSTTGFPNEHPMTKREMKRNMKRSRYSRRFQLHYTKEDIEYFEENNIDYKQL